MTERNVELVRRAVELFGGDSPRDVFDQGLATPDAQWHAAREFDTDTYVGADGFLSFMAAWTDPFEQWSMEPTEVRAVGDRIVVFAHQHAIGKGSGVRVDMEFAMVFTLRDEKIADVRAFLDRDEALAAAAS